MEKSIVLGILQNTAILLAFSMLYDYVWIKEGKSRQMSYKILNGFLVGFTGIILMLTPWTFIPGIVFDTRSILLSITGLFFGIVPTVIAIVIIGLFRFIMGGEGVWMGIAVVITSGSAGLLWRYYRSEWKNKNYVLELYFMGLIVHLIMLICTIFLPSDTIISTLKSILLTVILIYPIGTMLLGIFMIKRFKNWETKLALRDSEEKYKRLYCSMQDAYAMIDLDGRITESNPAFRNMLGYSEEELLKLAYTDITPKKWHSFEENIIKNQILRRGSSKVYEKEYIHKNGNIFPVELRTFLLRDGDGNPKSMWSIVREISERKRIKDELIKAKERAEENDKLKSLFLANMSHEIRTPMNAIMGFSDLLSDTRLDEAKRERFIGIIQDSSKRLLQIIEDIMDISKIEARQLKLNYSECRIYDVFKKSLEDFKNYDSFQNKKDLELIIDFPEKYKDLLIITDSLRIQQIFENLIHNAIKYTEKGYVKFGLQLKSENGENYLKFYVQDTGIGIPGNKVELVFERFRQLNEDEFHDGTGLGLSISKGIIELMGGKIWCNSVVNKGSTFYFTIPCQKQIDEYIHDVDSKGRRKFDLDNMSIIIAEDDLNSFLYIKELLNEQNVNILHAKNGKVLMEMLEKKLPDLILLDLNMPVKSGYDCIKEIRAKGLNTKIIVQTAYVLSHEKEECIELGCQGYISKPINKEGLYKVITQAMISELA